MRSNRSDVVNVFLSVLHILQIMFMHQCFVTNDFWLFKIIWFFFHLCLYGSLKRHLSGFAWLCSTFESCSWKEDISSFSKVYDFNIIHVMELTDFFFIKTPKLVHPDKMPASTISVFNELRHLLPPWFLLHWVFEVFHEVAAPPACSASPSAAVTSWSATAFLAKPYL